jgi:hypothetical protein
VRLTLPSPPSPSPSLPHTTSPIPNKTNSNTPPSGFNHNDGWGHRAGEPNKAVICSLALARLRTDIRGDAGGAAVGMAQKLLLFWRKPARRCWWEGVELHDVEGVQGPLKVWIRRVWTLEMSVIGLR